jgi:hydrogenase nickel incorporation protein HypA/HybF
VHELSVASAILETVRKHADERPVTVVSLRVGRLRQVVPRSLAFYWEIVSRNTICHGARLELEEIESRLQCTSCGHEWEPLLVAFRCERCGAGDVEVRSGEELEVDYIEVQTEQEEAACTGPR